MSFFRFVARGVLLAAEPPATFAYSSPRADERPWGVLCRDCGDRHPRVFIERVMQ